MSIRNRALCTSPIALLALAGPALAESLAVKVELPDSQQWTQVTDKVVGEAYSREWVPKGRDAVTTDWLIAQQKIPVDGKTDSMKFLENVYGLLENACTSTSHDEPEKLKIGSARAAVGRTMCAQRINEKFGSFSDQLVVVEDGFAYIVTSELRVPAMVVAGVVSFGHGKDAKAAAAKFESREAESKSLVRDRVLITAN